MTTRNRPHVFAATTPLFLLVLFAATRAFASPVAIQVENQKGKPIDGAEVTVRSQEGEAPLVTAITSDRGVAVINELGPGEWYFEITRPGYMMFSAYVRLRDGKKPELGFASQVSRGDDWEPMRVKFTKASVKLARDAVNAPTPEPRVRQPVRVEADESPAVITRVEPTSESKPTVATEPDGETITEAAKPEQRPVEGPVSETAEVASSTTAVVVPSVIEDVEPERSADGETAPPSLTVADGDPLPRSATESNSDDSEAASREQADPAQADSDDLAPENALADTDTVEDAPQTPTLDSAAPEEAIGQPTPEVAAQPEPTLPEQALPEPALPEPVQAPEGQVVIAANGAAAEEAEPSEAASSDLADSPIEQPQTPTTPPVAVASDQLDFLSTPPRYLRSAAAGNCPECAGGEWAVSAAVEAGTAGDTRSTSTCAADLADRAQQFAEQLVNRPQGAFVGPMMAALWRTASDSARTALVTEGSELMSPGGFCQVVGVLLPKGATMTGYSLEAWDDLGGRACNAEGICALPKAGWSGSPTVVSGENATVIYSVFRNRSTRHQRNAELTVLFTPPAEWQ